MIEKYKDKIEYSGKFPVRCEIESFPKVDFHVVYEDIPTAVLAKQTLTVMENFVFGYNLLHFTKPIGQVSEVKDDSIEGELATAVHIQVDFGKCSPKAIMKAIETLDQSALPIVRIVLK